MERGPNQTIPGSFLSGSVDGGAASQSASSTRKAAAPAKNRQIPISTGSTSGAAATTAPGRLSEAQVTSFRSTFTTWLKEHVEAMRWNSKITSRADIRRILEVLKGEVAGGTQSSARSVISGVFACRINGLGLPDHNSCGIAVLKTDYQPPQKQVPAGTPERRERHRRHQCDKPHAEGDSRDDRYLRSSCLGGLLRRPSPDSRRAGAYVDGKKAA
jgi:hypothetical protein